MRFYSSETQFFIRKLATFFVVCFVIYYAIATNFIQKNSPTRRHADDFSAASQDAKSLNPDNPYGLSFIIIAEASGLNWYEAKDFCEKQNATVINTKQASEIMNTIYLVPSANCKERKSEGYHGCLPIIIEQQPLKQYLNSLNSGDPYQILIWTSEKADKVNGTYLLLSENGANFWEMAFENDAITLCAK